ncbi:MAG TPA: sigma-70 family RNA polymerase sigma factor [Bryobacteraceae bacterium]
MPLEYDAELMLRVKDGDSASFALLLDRHRPAILRFIYRKVRNQAMAEELSQEVFLRVYRSRHTYQATAKFRTWLFRIATHLTLNALRDSKKDAWHERLNDEPLTGPVWQISDGKPSVEARMVREAELDEVRRAIAELPDVQRTAVRMQRYDELEYAEIARMLECSESAVKSLMFRAHEALRRRLAYLVPIDSSRGAAAA